MDDYEYELIKRRRLHRFGLALYIIGGGFCTVGAISMWSSYAHFLSHMDTLAVDQFGITPKYAWCFFAGIPFLGVGMAIRMYVAGRNFQERRKKKSDRP